MVLHKHGDCLYNGLTKTLTEHLQEVANQVQGSPDVKFLSDLKRKWDDHIKSTQMVRDILMVRTALAELAPVSSQHASVQQGSQ